MNGERITNIDTTRGVSLELYKEAFIEFQFMFLSSILLG